MSCMNRVIVGSIWASCLPAFSTTVHYVHIMAQEAGLHICYIRTQGSVCDQAKGWRTSIERTCGGGGYTAGCDRERQSVRIHAGCGGSRWGEGLGHCQGQGQRSAAGMSKLACRVATGRRTADRGGRPQPWWRGNSSFSSLMENSRKCSRHPRRFLLPTYSATRSHASTFCWTPRINSKQQLLLLRPAAACLSELKVHGLWSSLYGGIYCDTSSMVIIPLCKLN